MSDKETNLILELDVDLEQEKSLEELRHLLEQKRLEWSNTKSGNYDQAAKLRADENLRAYESYKKALNNESSLKILYQEARQLREEQRKKAKDELTRTIDQYQKGPHNESNIKGIIERFKKHGYSEQEIRNLIEGDKSKGKAAQITWRFDSLHQNLDIFKLKNLAEFLELSNLESCSLQTLRNKSKELQDKYRRIRNSEEARQKKEMAAICYANIFNNEESYSLYRDWLKELPIKNLIQDKLHGFKQIGIQQYFDILSSLQKGLKESISSTQSILDNYLLENRITAHFEVGKADAEIICYCSLKAKLMDYSCANGHSLFYRCAECERELPRTLLQCKCGSNLDSLVGRVKAAMDARDLELLANIAAEQKILEIDYFDIPHYRDMFSKIDEALIKRKQAAKRLEEQYQLFQDFVNRGEINKAFAVWNEEFKKFSGFSGLLDKISQYKPSKICIVAVRDRGDKKILQLKVPPELTHIGVKYSNNPESAFYSVAEIKNMLEVSGSCQSLSMYGIIRFGNRELRGETIIQSFGKESIKQQIQFWLDWPKKRSLFSSKILKIKIKNTSHFDIYIPKTLLIGDRSLAIPYKRSHGEVLTEIGPNTLKPQQEVSWEYSLKSIHGDFSVNLFAKDDTETSFEPAPGVILSNNL